MLESHLGSFKDLGHLYMTKYFLHKLFALIWTIIIGYFLKSSQGEEININNEHSTNINCFLFIWLFDFN